MSWSYAQVFVLCFVLRYARLVINLISFWTFRPIAPTAKPKFSSSDATVIIPTLDGDGDDLMATIKSMLANQPHEIILVTIEANERRALAMVHSLNSKRVRVLTVAQPNKRRQMCRAIPEVTTPITIFADDDVFWPSTAMPWILEPFRSDKMGGVVTCQRIRRADNATFAERIWEFLGAIYLERRNFDCAATSHMDGGVPCLSGRTCAYRTSILRDDASFTYEFTNETWWRGRFQLKADDDNFITRWLVNHGWNIYMQYHPECEVQTVLAMNSKYLKQCARWARSNWRSNLTSIFIERTIWRRQPYSTYAVQLTTLAPPAVFVEGAIVYFCHKMTLEWDPDSRWTVLYGLFAWMFLSKWIKLIGHYMRFPSDIVLLPVSIMFGYLHGIIKMYAFLTLNVTAWGSREGADINDEERMRRIRRPDYSPEGSSDNSYESAVDWNSWKADTWDLEAPATRQSEKGPPTDGNSTHEEIVPLMTEHNVLT